MGNLTISEISEHDPFTALTLPHVPEQVIDLEQESFDVESKSVGDTIKSFLGDVLTGVAIEVAAKAVTGCDPTIGTITLLAHAIPDLLEQAISFYETVETAEELPFKMVA